LTQTVEALAATRLRKKMAMRLLWVALSVLLTTVPPSLVPIVEDPTNQLHRMNLTEHDYPHTRRRPVVPAVETPIGQLPHHMDQAAKEYPPALPINMAIDILR
tara:strand:+ start:3992 stop:4300 length:309 start_codon:yes stop_codon:yes gene_type:complete